MQFTARLLAISAVVSQALALPVLTNSAYTVTEGKAFEITWTNATSPVSLALKSGVSTDLTTYTDIAAGLTGDSYSWTPENIPSGTYAIAITDSSGETNYSPQFTYQGTGTATTATSATASTTATGTTSTSASSTETGSTTSSTVTSASSSATLTSSASGSSNGTSTASSTLSTSTKSSSTATTTTSSSGSTSTPVNTNDSQKMGSPLALVMLTIAALMICH